MDENKERTKGKLEEIGGSIKETVGEWTGNERMETEGRGHKLEGQDRQDFAKGVGQLKGTVEDVKGNVKEGFGKITGDDSLRAEGMADEAKGSARKEFNQ
jgi:uncharacterized protein YjbJ (UPF0337 family)